MLAVEDGHSPFEQSIGAIQLAFFRQARDVSRRQVLDEIAEALEIPTGEVSRVIDDGRAFAELAHDTELQREHRVSVTPSLVLDDGRQLLTGNVAYPAIEAKRQTAVVGGGCAHGGRRRGIALPKRIRSDPRPTLIYTAVGKVRGTSERPEWALAVLCIHGLPGSSRDFRSRRTLARPFG